MVRVLAKAEIGDNHHLRNRIPHRTNRILDHSISGIGSAAPRILPFRNPKENHRGNPQGFDFLHPRQQGIEGMLEMTRHGGDGGFDPLSFPDKERHDKIPGIYFRLTKQVSKTRVGP